jgi:hypothetical protein
LWWTAPVTPRGLAEENAREVGRNAVVADHDERAPRASSGRSRRGPRLLPGAALPSIRTVDARGDLLDQPEGSCMIAIARPAG